LADVATIASLMITTSLFGFSNAMVAPLLPKIQRSFGAGVGFGGLVFAISLAIAGPGTLLVALAAEKFGNRPVLLTVLSMYVAASVAVALSYSVPVVLVARGAQGLSGALLPCSYAVVRSVYSGRKAVRVTALLSGCLGFAGGIGLFVVGLSDMPYRSVAMVWWAGTGLFGLVLVALFVPRDRPVAADGPSRAGEIGTFSAGVLLVLLPLLYMRWFLDHVVLGSVSLVVGVALVALSPRLSAEGRSTLFPARGLVVANVTNICSISGFFGMFVVAPPYLVERYPDGWLGRGLLPMAVVLLFPSVASMAGSRLAGRMLARRFGAADRLVTLGGLVAACGLLVCGVWPGVVGVMMASMAVVGLGTGAAFAGLAESLARSGSVASRTGTLVAGRYAGGALGGALVAVILDNHTAGSGLAGTVRLSLFILALVQIVGTGLWTGRGAFGAARGTEIAPAA
jgi:MFS family permease